MKTDALEKRLGHCFIEKHWLRTALTHRSFGTPHYERLEFLGDSILDTVIAKILFEKFPQLPEGELSRLRSSLVNQNTLVEIAKTLEIGRSLFLGEGEEKSGGRERASILADVVEALFGALWQDTGFEKASEIISNLYAPLLPHLVSGEKSKDAKSRLQEFLQGRRMELPIYTATTEGAAHAQSFTVLCEIPKLALQTEGKGHSRKTAEQNAAFAALQILEGKT